MPAKIDAVIANPYLSPPTNPEMMEFTTRSISLWALSIPLLLTTLLLHPASADISFTSPAGGSTQDSSGITVEWKDSGHAPALSDLTTFNLFLCSGDDAHILPLVTLAQNQLVATSSKLSFPVPPNVGDTTKNAYFLKIEAVAAAGGTVQNFSDRFSMKNMAGVFSDVVAQQLKGISGTKGPPTVNAVVGVGAQQPPPPAAGGGGVPAGTAGFDVPYDQQGGATRYAPMQPMAGTKITAQDMKRQWPTSAYTIYTTNGAPPAIATTITQPQTGSVASIANPAAAAPMPGDDMQMFLERWRD